MSEPFPNPLLRIPEVQAKRGIWIFSGIVFLIVVVLGRVQMPAPDGLDPHLFARTNAVLNSMVSLLLLAGLFSARARRWGLHRRIMLMAMALSILFLLSYILHHMFAGETRFGGTGAIKGIYLVILASHIILAATSLPFILITAYRALSGKYPAHRRLARRIWPVWFYVSVTGVVVYLMISPYY
ncbi:MAG: DUF420 domain-containing protein [Flavobacteriales bacterium]|nr:DUF420 domain-containing protein [Flavobacteriales bacterium]MCB9193407.1 DUF420 domain-containing protein [Flavobacteriales bacterium]